MTLRRWLRDASGPTGLAKLRKRRNRLVARARRSAQASKKRPVRDTGLWEVNSPPCAGAFTFLAVKIEVAVRIPENAIGGRRFWPVPSDFAAREKISRVATKCQAPWLLCRRRKSPPCPRAVEAPAHHWGFMGMGPLSDSRR
jgi:hypothetical protein